MHSALGEKRRFHYKVLPSSRLNVGRTLFGERFLFALLRKEFKWLIN